MFELEKPASWRVWLPAEHYSRQCMPGQVDRENTARTGCISNSEIPFIGLDSAPGNAQPETKPNVGSFSLDKWLKHLFGQTLGKTTAVVSDFDEDAIIRSDLVTPRSNHTATLLTNGQLLLAAGYDGVAETAYAELYNPATNRWRATGSLNQARYFHAACRLADGRVLVAGGENTGANRLNSAEIYDPATGQWTFTGSLIAARALFEMAQLPDGRVLATDGLTSLATGPVSELYDPATGVWSATGSPNLTSRNGTHLTALQDGRVLLAGGGVVETELYDPATGT